MDLRHDRASSTASSDTAQWSLLLVPYVRYCDSEQVRIELGPARPDHTATRLPRNIEFKVRSGTRMRILV